MDSSVPDAVDQVGVQPRTSASSSLSPFTLSCHNAVGYSIERIKIVSQKTKHLKKTLHHYNTAQRRALEVSDMKQFSKLKYTAGVQIKSN